jgi:hypothetical protein
MVLGTPPRTDSNVVKPPVSEKETNNHSEFDTATSSNPTDLNSSDIVRDLEMPTDNSATTTATSSNPTDLNSSDTEKNLEMPTDNSATTTATSSNPTSDTERNGDKPSENSGSYDINDSSGIASSKSSRDSDEIVENKIDVDRYLEEASQKCKDSILPNFATYCIVIPMNELPNRKLMCRLQIHSPSQNDWYNASFKEYVRDANGNMGFLERNNRMRHVGDVIIGVNGIHLKGWDGQEVFELIGILLKDENTTELRLTLEAK